jgi:hypothetical protein
LVAATLLVAGRQITLRGWYAAHPAYRAQVNALLDGRLALSTLPDAMQFDYAWTESGMQQVWGLGVALWQLPFELAGRAIGLSPFPDRIALLAWLALMFATAIRAWWRRDQPWLAAGTIAIAALLPPLITVVRGRVGVYEEATIYAYAGAILLLAGTQRTWDAPSRARYLLLLAAAGAAGLVRPTVWFYGLATAIVASWRWLAARGRRGVATVALGGVLFVAGGAVLYATNARRFGDGMEFGHRLNLESKPGNLYATRFGYPFEHASLPAALAEELGALFDRPDKHVHTTFYGRNLHVGQSPIVRWREYYFTTFTWGYAPVVLAGLVLGALAWRRRRDPESWLFAWAVLGGGPLFVFYLHAPSMSSRYQLDLAPAIAALLIVAWRAIAGRVPVRLAFGVLAAAWLVSIALARTAEPRSAEPVDRAAAARATDAIVHATPHVHELGNAYDLTDPWLPTRVDVDDHFDACTDEAGAPIDPDASPAGGERCLHGERDPDGRDWIVAISEIPLAVEPPPVCTVDEPVCPLAATVATAGEITSVVAPEPALYLNMFRWDLRRGGVPAATFAWLQDPAYVQLDVAVLDGTAPPLGGGAGAQLPAGDGKDVDWAREIRVTVGRTRLHLASIASLPTGVRLRFEGAPLPPGLTVAFFAFGPEAELASVRTRFAVTRVEWR